MFNNTGVVVCLVLLIPGIICYITDERRDNSGFQKWKIRNLETDQLVKPIFVKLATEDKVQNERANTNDEVSEIDRDLRKLANMLDENVMNNMKARTEDLLAANTEIPRKRQIRRACGWWWTCDNITTKVASLLPASESDSDESDSDKSESDKN